MRSALILFSFFFHALPVAHGSSWREDPEVSPFQKSYLRLEMARNFPVSFSQNRLEPGGPEPALDYVHDIDANWLMGIGGQFKVLRRLPPEEGENPSRWLSLWTISHETLYAVRLHHPTYLLMGPKILYLLPALSGRLPLKRDSSYETEIGGGISVQLVHLLGDRGLLSLRVDRWRGTKTMRLHGLEVAAGVAYAIEGKRANH